MGIHDIDEKFLEIDSESLRICLQQHVSEGTVIPDLSRLAVEDRKELAKFLHVVQVVDPRMAMHQSLIEPILRRAAALNKDAQV